jgi:hypothetical protein
MSDIILSSFEIKKLLHKYIPKDRLFCVDKKYFLPSKKFLWNELISQYIDDYKYTLDIFDCDDFTLILHAWIIQKSYADKWDYPMCFGQLWKDTHMVNISILDTKEVVLIEPQKKNKDISITIFHPDSSSNIVFCRV